MKVMSLFWRMSTGRQIALPAPISRDLSADWDSHRLRCWPPIELPRLSSARCEVLVAKAMCALFAVSAASMAVLVGA